MFDLLERYYTPKKFTFELLKVLDLDDMDPHLILEPCSGDGAIKRAIQEFGWTHKIITNDLDPEAPSQTHYNACSPKFWHKIANLRMGPPSWTITNPPFSKAWKIIPQAYAVSTEGVAAYLRLSWLEPCGNRFLFLQKHPPNRLVILPRHSFTENGKVDSVTGCWIIWDKDPTPITDPIKIYKI